MVQSPMHPPFIAKMIKIRIVSRLFLLRFFIVFNYQSALLTVKKNNKKKKKKRTKVNEKKGKELDCVRAKDIDYSDVELKIR